MTRESELRAIGMRVFQRYGTVILGVCRMYFFFIFDRDIKGVNRFEMFIGFLLGPTV